MSSIKEYKIAVPDESIDTLRKKLELARFPDELDGAGWDYGAPLKDIKRLTSHWLNNYNWREHEEKLNKTVPQYTTEVPMGNFGTLNIHFVHQKSEVESAIPLLFVHGWPGSFVEVLKILPELVKGGKEYPAFHVVAPSLPNFGFSEGVKMKGFAGAQYAEVCHKLMLSLGYPKYVTQGGDWGYFITRAMGMKYPDNVLASHINMPRASPPTYSSPVVYLQHLTTPYSEREKAGLARAEWFMKEGSGYNREQATKPQTIGYSQADSPVGLLAWIYEKLHDWTDDYAWADDEILTWISIYWFSTAGPAAASRIYYEVAHDKAFPREALSKWSKPKLGIANFPKELTPTPKVWHKTLGDVVFESEYTHGGHFAAWEKPEAIVSDLRKMFGKGGGAYGVVKGKTGYSDRPSMKSRL